MSNENVNVKKEEPTTFTDMQLDQLDLIDNTAFELLQILAVGKDGEAPEWNMELIGDVVDAAEGVLLAHGFSVYYPYYTEENGKDVIYDLEMPDGSGANL